MLDSKRREFIALLGGGVLLLAAKVRRARGQQAAMPVIGFVHAGSPEQSAEQVGAWPTRSNLGCSSAVPTRVDMIGPKNSAPREAMRQLFYQ